MKSSRQQRSLLLLRHGKSSWDNSALADIDRPLALRGIAAATAMGGEMARSGLVPDRILCSPARRASDTLRLVAASFPQDISPETIEGLYDFGDGSALLEIIQRHGGKSHRLMLVGHNPALQQLALRLGGPGDPAQRQAIARKFPTTALAILDFELEDWAELADGKGGIARFIRPRDVLKK